MGHDITAYDSKHNELAYLRYSAFDSSAVGIYEALDAMKAYAGCSGGGIGRSFSRNSIQDAIRMLQRRGDDHYISIEREPNFADALFDMLADISGIDLVEKGQSYSSINRAIAFLKQVVAAMDEREIKNVNIFFG